MTAEEQATLVRIEAQVTALRGELMGRLDRHEARHDALDDASRARHIGLEHRVTGIEVGLGAVQRDVCGVKKAIRQRTLTGGVVVGIGAVLAALAQWLGLGKP